jgi:hypothetical protein
MQEWILFDAYDDYFRANLMLTKLRDEGFGCQLKDENTVNADPLLSNAIGGIKIMVLKEEETALKEWHSKYLIALEEKQICPRCKKIGVIKNPNKSKSSSIFAFLDALFNATSSRNRNYKCKNCGHTFDEMIFV